MIVRGFGCTGHGICPWNALLPGHGNNTKLLQYVTKSFALYTKLLQYVTKSFVLYTKLDARISPHGECPSNSEILPVQAYFIIFQIIVAVGIFLTQPLANRQIWNTMHTISSTWIDHKASKLRRTELSTDTIPKSRATPNHPVPRMFDVAIQSHVISLFD